MSERAWQLYLDDMIVFCERVLSYTEGYEQTQFENTGLLTMQPYAISS